MSLFQKSNHKAEEARRPQLVNPVFVATADRLTPAAKREFDKEAAVRDAALARRRSLDSEIDKKMGAISADEASLLKEIAFGPDRFSAENRDKVAVVLQSADAVRMGMELLDAGIADARAARMMAIIVRDDLFDMTRLHARDLKEKFKKANPGKTADTDPVQAQIELARSINAKFLPYFNGELLHTLLNLKEAHLTLGAKHAVMGTQITREAAAPEKKADASLKLASDLSR